MEMSDLFRSLKDQYQFLEAFLNTIMLQQRAIIENDVTGMEETVKTEGALLIHIDQYEKQMIGIINELSKKYSLGISPDKLSDFVNAVQLKKDIDCRNLIKTQSALKKLALRIAKINAQNKLLIEQARSFVQDTIAVIINANKNKILDRKI